MSRYLCSVSVAVATLIGMTAAAGGGPDGDFVVGSGRIEILDPLIFPRPLPFDVSIDAHSDASGENPSGSFLLVYAPLGLVVRSGPVTCLAVTGNTAIIGFEDRSAGHMTVEVVDGGPDTVSVPISGVSGCSRGSGISVPLLSGDLVVHDALPLISKDQCKDGGWRDFSDDEGHPFDNQGQCVTFLESHAS
jgi:hypothetical protein